MVRIVHFALRSALWGDESALAMNIVPKSIGELGRPFVYTQICPWGYLFVTKVFTLVLGNGEHALRSFSLLSGLLVPPLVYLVGRRAAGPRAGLISLFLAAVSPWLVYYSAELKPYATDAFCAVATLAFTAEILRRPEDRRLQIGLLLFGAVAVWLSIPAIFTLGGAAAALGIAEIVTKRRPKALLLVGTAGAVWVGGFFIHLTLFLQGSSAATASGVSSFWTDGFMPFPPTNLKELMWLPGKFFYLFVEPGGFYRMLRVPLGLAFLFGCWVIFRRNRAFLIALLCPLVLLVTASALGRYPIGPRLILFVVPIQAIGLGAAGGALLARETRGARWATAVALVIAFGGAVLEARGRLEPTLGPDVADLAEKLAREARPTDGIFIDDDVQWSFLYYDWKYEIPGERIDTSKIRPETVFVVGEWQEHLKQLEPLFSKKRAWLLLSTFYRPGRGATFDRYYTAYVESRGGRRIEETRADGHLLVLYDLSGASP